MEPRARFTGFAALAASLVLVAACDGAIGGSPTPRPVTASPVTFAPSQGAVMTLDEIGAACAITKAWGGLGSPVPLLAPCSQPVSSYPSLPSGSVVTTDSCGQAWLKTDCGTLYVFQATSLTASTCQPPGAVNSSGCLTSGTVAWAGSSCPSEVVIGTPGAGIRLSGTWVSATYLEEEQLTLFAVFDGVGEATPLLDAGGQKAGAPATVAAGNFWFSAPGDQAPVVADVPGRVAQPFERLPDVVRELHLESWFSAVLDRAAQDGIDLSQVPPIPVVNVRLAGGDLEDPRAREPLLLGFDWGARAKVSLPAGDRAIVALAGDDPPLDLLAQVANIDLAQRLMKEHGGFAVEVIWEERGDLGGLMKEYLGTLLQLGLDAQDRPAVDSEDAASMFADFVTKEQAVIWLSDH